ncbi:MAG: HlyD family efflux transporter periplasmic adaptor subunit, partial [Ruminococcaceae bacterium]|nr:HlyD family efflux transporter periplasmic adaptor subunit [Oscillospiraceae bacterium]
PEHLKKLDKQLNKINSSDDEKVIKADSKARVKKVFVKKGSDVEDTVTANGALILLSLDGLMAVDIERTADTRLGDSITVVLSDKTKLSGSIISVNTNYVTCAVSDKKAAYKDKVKVLDASGKEIGSSELYIHSVLPVIAYAGKVKTVSVKLNQVVEKGDKLLTLTGTKYSGEFSNLMYKRSVLEDQMKELFELYQTGIIYADHDGEVAGINEGDDEEEEEDEETTKSEKLSSATKKLGKLTVRTDDANANPPDGSDASSFINYVFVMGGFKTKDGKTTINLNSNVTSTADMQAFTIDDYTVAPKNVSSEQYKNTLLEQYSPDVPIYSYDSAKKEWTTFSIEKLAMGDILVLTMKADGNAVWLVRYPAPSSGQGGQGGEGGQGGQGGQGQGGQGQGGFPGGWNGRIPGGGNWGSLFGGNRGSFGGYSAGAGTGINQGTEQEEETYEMEETLIASIVNLDTMSITLSVDELDVININSTQEVTVTLDAVKDKTYKGKIVSIDTDGVRSGTGNAKYSVKIDLERTSEMLTNMSASVRANISTAEVLCVPAEALIEKENKTYVYTSYDKEKDELSGEVEIKTGMSDGKNVEILSGLSEGDKIWYKYADGLVYKFVR